MWKNSFGLDLGNNLNIAKVFNGILDVVMMFTNI